MAGSVSRPPQLVQRVQQLWALGRRCIAAGGVAHLLRMSNMLALRALPAARIASLGVQIC
jgi:hypothetical protein